MNHLEDAALVLCIFEYCDSLDLIRCESTKKRWRSLLLDKENSFINGFWRLRYQNLLQIHHPITSHNGMLDWRGKFADVHPICGGQLSTKQSQVYISDVRIGKLRLSCRSGHTATLIDDDILILFGGASHLFMFTNTCDIISFKQNKVLSVNKHPTNPPIPRWLHTASQIHNKIIIFGGQSDRGLENDLNLMTLQLSDTGVANILFTPILSTGTVPIPRGGHSMVVDAGRERLILFGGMTAGQICVNDLLSLSIEEVFDIDGEAYLNIGDWSTIETHGTPPSPRWCHSTCLVGQNMVVFGGWRYASVVGTRHDFSSDVHIFNLQSNTWTTIETTGISPRPRCQSPCWHIPSVLCRPFDHHEADSSHVGGYLVIYGGACHHDVELTNGGPANSQVIDLGDMLILDLDTRAWLPFNYQFPRYHFGNDCLLVYGMMLCYRCRGGTNAIIYTPKGWVLSGGMHSETQAHTPRFKNDLVYIQPNLGGCNNVSPAFKIREDLRIASKFIFFVDAK